VNLIAKQIAVNASDAKIRKHQVDRSLHLPTSGYEGENWLSFVEARNRR
jgi:hypothetical protein